jgi:hypothetical protein
VFGRGNDEAARRDDLQRLEAVRGRPVDLVDARAPLPLPAKTGRASRCE